MSCEFQGGMRVAGGVAEEALKKRMADVHL
jgi:hypothetical protein